MFLAAKYQIAFLQVPSKKDGLSRVVSQVIQYNLFGLIIHAIRSEHLLGLAGRCSREKIHIFKVSKIEFSAL